MQFCILLIIGTLIWVAHDTDERSARNYSKKQQKSKKTAKPKSRPVTVEKEVKAPEFQIRNPEEKKAPVIVLDENKLDELKQQTKIAQELLADIFIVEDEKKTPDNITKNDGIIETLHKLLEKDIWTRRELEEMLGHGVMIGSVLEQINDYAYSKVEDIVVEEDGDTIYVTTEYKEQLICADQLKQRKGRQLSNLLNQA